MTAANDGARTSRVVISSELNQADAGEVIALASACLGDDPELTVTRPPVVGVVVTQVRDTVAEERFILGDVMVTQAEVTRRGEFGWAMRLGSDKLAALATAVLEAEWVARGPHAGEVENLVQRTIEARKAARAAEWEQLTPTIVEFEEIP